MNVALTNFTNYLKLDEDKRKDFEKIDKMFPNLIIKDWENFDFDPWNEDFYTALFYHCFGQIMLEICENYAYEVYDWDEKTKEITLSVVDDTNIEELNKLVSSLKDYGWTVNNYKEVVKEI